MKDGFYALADRLAREARGGEVILCELAAEQSDFVRFNHGRVRQAGTVTQSVLGLRLVNAGRQAATEVTLAGGVDDLERARAALATLRDVVAQVPEDPWLALPDAIRSTDTAHPGALPPPDAVVEDIVSRATGLDLVGFYAGGTIVRGFANSLGQRNWHEVQSFNLDWSLYVKADKAVKAGYAGLHWDRDDFATRLERAREQLAVLERPARTIEPGDYRTYLAPQALEELVGLLGWGGFSARARRLRQSPLLRMEHGARLSERVTLTENVAGGLAAPFQGEGHVKPATVPLIVDGALSDALVSPRSAREYGLVSNAANEREAPEAIELAPGTLATDDVLAALDTGLYVGNLWYLNYSDRTAARITGMTRFATFWVEHGRIVAPVNVMRFDDALYRLLGDQLVDLTREREWLLDTSTYGQRSTGSARLPGALLSALRYTL